MGSDISKNCKVSVVIYLLTDVVDELKYKYKIKEDVCGIAGIFILCIGRSVFLKKLIVKLRIIK